MWRVLPLLLILPACDLLFAPPAEDEPTRPRRDADECDNDRDCDGGERCDDGECVAIGEGEGEGEPPPPPPPACGVDGCPEILSFSSNRTSLGQNDTATLSAVVTDPDGVTDLLGGVLLDPTTDTTYGTFTATGAGTFSIAVDWRVLGAVRAVDFTTSTTRVVRGRFFDQGGLEAFADVTLTLACGDGSAACDGSCGRARCNGACRNEDDFVDDDNCGGCGVRCTGDAFCSTELGAPRCVGGGEGEGEGEPSLPFTGTPEDGVVCGAAGTCADACCFDLFSATPSCIAAADSCAFGGSATCDGPEDCGAGFECCFTGFAASCVSTGQCRTDTNNSEVCNANRDCLAGELCCTNGIVGAFGFDAGTCAVAQNGACP